jgi:branched-chain amino acid transport system substrate-binding protein
MHVSFPPGRSKAVALLVAGTCLLAACGGSDEKSGGSGGSAAGPATEIPIGAAVEVTGAASAIGTNWQKGIELAVDHANGKDGFEVDGKRYKWALDLKDDQSLPDQAIADYRGFVGDDVNFILGPGLSTAFPPAFNSLGASRPLVMTPAAAAASQFAGTGQGENLFITHLADKGDNGRVAKVVSTVVDKYKPKTAAILLPQDDAGELYTTTFTQYLKKAGVDVVFSKGFPSDTRDFSSYITALQAASPDVVVSGYLDTWMQPFVTQAVGAGMTDTVFVGAPGTNVSSVEKTPGVKDFVWSVTTRSVTNADDPQVEQFRKEWVDKYGTEPDAAGFWALSYYDPILILTQAMQEAGTVDDLAKIRDAMVGEHSWKDTVLGGYFDEKAHQAVYAPQIGIYKDGDISYATAD